jgi:Tfp pilus assembly protein PilV
MKLTPITNQQGISLLEIMVAMFFFAMITMGANTLMVGAVRANVMIKNTNQATQIANRMMDDLRSKPYASISNDTRTVNSKYNCEWTVNEANNMKKIILKVKWPSGKVDRQVEVSTLVAQ